MGVKSLQNGSISDNLPCTYKCRELSLISYLIITVHTFIQVISSATKRKKYICNNLNLEAIWPIFRIYIVNKLGYHGRNSVTLNVEYI